MQRCSTGNDQAACAELNPAGRRRRHRGPPCRRSRPGFRRPKTGALQAAASLKPTEPPFVVLHRNHVVQVRRPPSTSTAISAVNELPGTSTRTTSRSFGRHRRRQFRASIGDKDDYRNRDQISTFNGPGTFSTCRAPRAGRSRPIHHADGYGGLHGDRRGRPVRGRYSAGKHPVVAEPKGSSAGKVLWPATSPNVVGVAPTACSRCEQQLRPATPRSRCSDPNLSSVTSDPADQRRDRHQATSHRLQPRQLGGTSTATAASKPA